MHLIIIALIIIQVYGSHDAKSKLSPLSPRLTTFMDRQNEAGRDGKDHSSVQVKMQLSEEQYARIESFFGKQLSASFSPSPRKNLPAVQDNSAAGAAEGSSLKKGPEVTKKKFVFNPKPSKFSPNTTNPKTKFIFKGKSSPNKTKPKKGGNKTKKKFVFNPAVQDNSAALSPEPEPEPEVNSHVKLPKRKDPGKRRIMSSIRSEKKDEDPNKPIKDAAREFLKIETAEASSLRLLKDEAAAKRRRQNLVKGIMKPFLNMKDRLKFSFFARLMMLESLFVLEVPGKVTITSRSGLVDFINQNFIRYLDILTDIQKKESRQGFKNSDLLALAKVNDALEEAIRSIEFVVRESELSCLGVLTVSQIWLGSFTSAFFNDTDTMARMQLPESGLIENVKRRMWFATRNKGASKSPKKGKKKGQKGDKKKKLEDQDSISITNITYFGYPKELELSYFANGGTIHLTLSTIVKNYFEGVCRTLSADQKKFLRGNGLIPFTLDSPVVGRATIYADYAENARFIAMFTLEKLRELYYITEGYIRVVQNILDMELEKILSSKDSLDILFVSSVDCFEGLDRQEKEFQKAWVDTRNKRSTVHERLSRLKYHASLADLRAARGDRVTPKIVHDLDMFMREVIGKMEKSFGQILEIEAAKDMFDTKDLKGARQHTFDAIRALTAARTSLKATKTYTDKDGVQVESWSIADDFEDGETFGDVFKAEFKEHGAKTRRSRFKVGDKITVREYLTPTIELLKEASANAKQQIQKSENAFEEWNPKIPSKAPSRIFTPAVASIQKGRKSPEVSKVSSPTPP